MNILESIVEERRRDVDRAREKTSEAMLRARAAARTHHGLRERLGAGDCPHVIAEMKQASPSAGLLRKDYDPAAIAARYEAAGACGISVLTEPRHFLGSADHLVAARGACALPILRKDFLCDPYQVLEAAAWGADVVLVILAALTPGQADALYHAARENGLDVLAEAHTAREVEAALAWDEAIVGVNSRDLKTLKTDLRTARELAPPTPSTLV